MNCSEDKPCVWITSGPDTICGHRGRTKPGTEDKTYSQLINRSVAAQEWGGMDQPKDK
jgi:hypothetical protein